jgi:hypothetical protein
MAAVLPELRQTGPKWKKKKAEYCEVHNELEKTN